MKRRRYLARARAAISDRWFGLRVSLGDWVIQIGHMIAGDPLCPTEGCKNRRDGGRDHCLGHQSFVDAVNAEHSATQLRALEAQLKAEAERWAALNETLAAGIEFCEHGYDESMCGVCSDTTLLVPDWKYERGVSVGRAEYRKVIVEKVGRLLAEAESATRA